MIAVASASVDATMSGVSEFGSRCRNRSREPDAPDAPRRRHVVRFTQREQAAAQDAGEDRDVDDGHGEDDLR